MRIFENANYQFMRNRKIAYAISGALFVLSLASLLFRGLEVGIDFLGGMEFVVESDQPVSTAEVRSTLATALGSEPEVKTFDETGLLIRTASTGDINEVEAQVLRGVNEAAPGGTHRIVKTDIVGPRFAEDLKRGAFYSVIGSLIVIFLYIWVRFQWKVGYSVGAVAALVHDVVITLGMFSLMHHLNIVPFSLQIDQTIIAAFLTIVGYSINDTVVVFDRIREYTTMFKTENYENVVNRSINTTLSRTIITSGTTLLVVITLFIFGSEVLRGFAFALLFGIGIGTYSSIFVAAPIVVELRNRIGAR
ncbi:MAG: protein translocase subunit SecF [Rhodothermales bacterium]|nr:protein translocase subunit SecF [Rhodothermales bacterium]